MTGTVRGYNIGKNRDCTKDVLLLQVEMFDPDDIQTVEYMSHAGDDTVPPVGSVVTVLSIGQAWKIAVASNDNITPTMGEGEKKIYSSDGGAIKAFINFLSDGNIDLNGDSKKIVTYAALNTALQGLVTAINSVLATKLDGGGTPGTLTLDISAAESATVRIE